MANPNICHQLDTIITEQLRKPFHFHGIHPSKRQTTNYAGHVYSSLFDLERAKASTGCVLRPFESD
jgi:hypothetical protein